MTRKPVFIRETGETNEVFFCVRLLYRMEVFLREFVGGKKCTSCEMTLGETVSILAYLIFILISMVFSSFFFLGIIFTAFLDSNSINLSFLQKTRFDIYEIYSHDSVAFYQK